MPEVCKFCKKDIINVAVYCRKCDKYFHTNTTCYTHKVYSPNNELVVCKDDLTKVNLKDSCGSQQQQMDTTESASISSSQFEQLMSAITNCSNQVSALRKEQSVLNSDLSDIKFKVGCLPELQKKMEENSVKLNDIAQQTKELSSKVSQISEVNESLKVQVMELQSDRENLNMRLMRTEVKQCADSLVISGLPESSNEDLRQLVCLVASVLKVTLAPVEIIETFRMPSRNTSLASAESLEVKNRSVLVRFSSTRPGSEFVSAMKIKRSLLSTEVCSSLPKCRVYVNAYLPSDFYNLLKKVRNKAKLLQYRYVWHKESTIFVRRVDKGEVIKINTNEDLDLLKE